jgi:hypothetical protein
MSNTLSPNRIRQIFLNRLRTANLNTTRIVWQHMIMLGRSLRGRARYMYNREVVAPIVRQLNRQANVSNGHGNRRNRQSEEGAIRALYGMHIHGNRRRS